MATALAAPEKVLARQPAVKQALMVAQGEGLAHP
jgi:hypothetical protein